MVHDLTPELLRAPVESSRFPEGRSFEDRLVDRLYNQGDCLIFEGSSTLTGHGQLSLRLAEDMSAMVFVHRAAWVLRHGPIPDGMEVLHCCENNRCCNVDHLFLGTKQRRGQWMTERGHNAAQRYPEAARERITGDKNPTRKYPERLRRGDMSPSRLYPEKLKRGEQNHFAKLTEDDVRAIRARCARGEYQRVVAKDYGITQTQVSNIVRRYCWAHVGAAV